METLPDPSLPDRRSWRRVVPALLGIVVVVLVTLQAVEAERSASRSVGIVFAHLEEALVIERVEPGGPAERDGLEAGDRLVAIEGRPVSDLVDYDEAAASFARGRAVDFLVRRDGEERTVTVRPGRPFPWADFTFNIPAVAAHLALALLAFSQRPGDVRARLLGLLSLAVAVELALPVQLIGAPDLLVAVDVTFLLLTGLQMGFELHLASVIPRPRSWLQRHGWLRPAYYLAGFAFAGPALASVLADQFDLGALPWGYDQAFVLLYDVGLPTWAIAVLLLLGSAAVRHPEARGRHQAGLVFIGTLPWAALVISAMMLELMELPLPTWAVQVETLTLLCYPVATFIAIFRYHLFDLELVVRRSLVYGTLTLLLLLVFYGAVGVGGALLSARAGGGGSVAAVAVATLIMGLLFSPLKEAVQRLIDRHFFRERAVVRSEMVQLARRLPSLGRLPSMGRVLVSQLCEVLGVRSAALLLVDPESGSFSPLARQSPSFGEDQRSLLVGPDDPAVELLKFANRPIRARQVARQERSTLAEHVARSDVEVLVPILRQESMVGFLLLGSKESGEEYPAEEVELLAFLAHHVGTVFENARLFESATRDSLTGLLRREAVLDELTREVRRAFRFSRPLTIAMADLDHFKEINDRHGHLAGDLLLKKAARTLSRGLRSTDVVGRYGGEEFLIVLPETDLAGAIHGAQKVRGLIESLAVRLDGGETVSATVSIGLASLDEFPHDARPSVDTLIAAADARLYLAKHAGRNRVEPADGDSAGKVVRSARFGTRRG